MAKKVQGDPTSLVKQGKRYNLVAFHVSKMSIPFIKKSLRKDYKSIVQKKSRNSPWINVYVHGRKRRSAKHYRMTKKK